jgi:hypothetical protein
MIVLIFYGIATSLINWNVFDSGNLFKNENWKTRATVFVFVIRTSLMAASAAMMFTTEGKEIKYGFWIITNLVHFICHSIYEGLHRL